MNKQREEMILVINDNDCSRQEITQMLEKDGYRCKGLALGSKARELIETGMYSLIVVDVNLDKQEDISTLKQVRYVNGYLSQLLIMIDYTSDQIPPEIITKRVMEDYIHKPIKEDMLLHRVKKIIDHHKLEQQLSTFKKIATYDASTGLYNRRHFNKAIKQEIARAQRYKHSLSLMMIDIDNFKFVNDMLGHVAGDKVLQRCTQVLKNNVRKSDLMFSYGVEKFAVILSECEKEGAQKVAQRMQHMVAEITVNKSNSPWVTVSIGVVELDEEVQSNEQLIICAVKALCKAKYLGKDQVCVYKQDM